MTTIAVWRIEPERTDMYALIAEWKADVVAWRERMRQAKAQFGRDIWSSAASKGDMAERVLGFEYVEDRPMPGWVKYKKNDWLVPDRYRSSLDNRADVDAASALLVSLQPPPPLTTRLMPSGMPFDVWASGHWWVFGYRWLGEVVYFTISADAVQHIPKLPEWLTPVKLSEYYAAQEALEAEKVDA